MFILHAEHEMNCSTAAVRHLASSGVDVYVATAGAVGALYGPLHGGANEAVLRMLSRIGTVENIPKFLDGVKAKKARIPRPAPAALPRDLPNPREPHKGIPGPYCLGALLLPLLMHGVSALCTSSRPSR